MARTFQDMSPEEFLAYLTNGEFVIMNQVSVDDWPSGRNRVTMNFEVHNSPRYGQRVQRWQDGKKKNPKNATAYFVKALIVQDDEGQTFVVGVTNSRQIVVQWGNLKFPRYVYHSQGRNPLEDSAFFILAQMLGLKTPTREATA